MEYHRRILAGIVLAVLTIIPGCSSRRPPTPRPPVVFDLHIVVREDPSTGRNEPIEGVKVEVVDSPNMGKGGVSGQDGQLMITGIVEQNLNVCAEKDGWERKCYGVGPGVRGVNVDLLRSARPPPTDPPSDIECGIKGQLRIEPGGGFVDDRGPVLPIFLHAGDLLSRWTRGQQEQVNADLDDIDRACYDGPRTWTTLGSEGRPGDFWYGREVGPSPTYDRDGQYWNHWQAFLESLHSKGLKLQASQGDTFPKAIPNRSEFVREQANRIGRVSPSVVALWEFGNESWQTGEREASRAAGTASEFRSHRPEPLIGLSSPPEGEDAGALKSWSRNPASLWIIHGYRQGHWWDKVRHIFSLQYENCIPHDCLPLGWQGEPPGFGTLVSDTQNKHELDEHAIGLMAAMSLMTRQGYVVFSGPGVISDCKAGEQINHGRYTCNGERLQDMPGFATLPRKVKRSLPPDIMRYGNRFFHGGETWAHRRVFEARGENRADGVWYPDGRTCQILYGPDYSSMPMDREFREGRKTFNITHDTTFGDKGRVVCGTVH